MSALALLAVAAVILWYAIKSEPRERYHDSVDRRASCLPLGLRQRRPTPTGAFAILRPWEKSISESVHAKHLLTGKGGAKAARRLLREKAAAEKLAPVRDIKAGGRRRAGR